MYTMHLQYLDNISMCTCYLKQINTDTVEWIILTLYTYISTLYTYINTIHLHYTLTLCTLTLCTFTLYTYTTH